MRRLVALFLLFAVSIPAQKLKGDFLRKMNKLQETQQRFDATYSVYQEDLKLCRQASQKNKEWACGNFRASQIGLNAAVDRLDRTRKIFGKSLNEHSSSLDIEERKRLRQWLAEIRETLQKFGLEVPPEKATAPPKAKSR